MAIQNVEKKFVIIVGAGKTGYNLAKLLMEEGHEVLLVEKNKTRYFELNNELGENIFLGDASESDILKNIGTNRADVLVAVTGDDDTNLVICQLAKIMYMIPRTIARISNPKNEDIFSSLGVDNVVNTTQIVNSLIEKEVDAGMLVPVMELKGGKVEIIETEITSNSPVINKQIKDIKLPEDCLIVSVVRGDDVIFPHGNTVLEKNDTVMALVSKDKKAELRKIL
ncbi:MAG: NAD-binding protein [Candidatus Goldbacteria bacterium]|nr:NAD-binding protein [Candidatus Goldiibacteriota bacterium]HPD18078.1 NAD-binding protein [Candidatus Goldiibacteriota bacterium]